MPIQIIPYNSQWPQQYEKEVAFLQVLFRDVPLAFHHIGSTAISKCAAKPIIDILGVTSDITRIDDTHHLAPYTPLGEYGMKQRRYFKKEGANLHIFEDSDPEVTRHLRFVTYLNTHPEETNIYSELKKRLANRYPNDIEKYLLGKMPFIKKIDIKAASERTPPFHYSPLGPRKKKWAKEEIIKAAHVNLQLQMTYFTHYLSTMHIFFQPDVTVIYSNIQDDTFNIILSARFTSSHANDRIQVVLNHYHSLNLPFSWWVSESEDTPSNLAHLLSHHGLSLSEENIGMYLKLESYDKKPVEREIERLVSEQQLQSFTHVITALGLSPAIYSHIYQPLPSLLYEEGAPYELYLLYDGGKPVTTGVALFHANVCGIYYIATLAAHRKQGHGTAMMHFLLRKALDKGYGIATLAASKEGKNLYQRLGFKPCCRFLEYSF